jgi:hypothetical protein
VDERVTHHDAVGAELAFDSDPGSSLNAKLPLLDQYGRARQDGKCKYSQ